MASGWAESHERSANVEAIGHLHQGLELLQTLPETPARLEQELDLQITLGPALRPPKATRPLKSSTPTRVLGSSVNTWKSLTAFPHVAWFMELLYMCVPSCRRRSALGEQLLTLAQQVQDTAMLVAAHRALGVTLFYRWERQPSRTRTLYRV